MWAVILVAWLATMPQLMPQQQSEFFNWAITTILPAVTLLFEGGFPAAQLGACLALVLGMLAECCNIIYNMSIIIPSPSSHPPLLFPPPQRGALPTGSRRSKCWRRGRGRHTLSMRRNNSAKPSA